jgi:hypothetical protein
MPESVECEESDALDYVESLDKAHTCNVTWEAGPSSEVCVLEGTGSGAGWSMLPEACRDAAASGWGRS